MARTIYRRGDIYFADLDPVYGCVHGGSRPVVIIQNDIGNCFSPTLIVAPVTSKTKKKPGLPTHVILSGIPGMESCGGSLCMLEQIRVIDKRRIGRYVASLNDDQIKEIDRALLSSLGLEGIDA